MDDHITNLLIKFFEQLIQILKGTDALAEVNVGDVIRVARYIQGALADEETYPTLRLGRDRLRHEITAREIQKLKKELYEIIAMHSGKDYETVWKDSDRDYWMTAEEAKNYGMIDEVLLRNKATK